MNTLRTYVAFLRGINVGGHSIVSMAELKQCLVGSGFQDVRTYINSGNVIFSAPATDPRTLEVTIEKQLQATFSLSIRVVIRTKEEMHKLIAAIPDSWDRSDRKYNVILLHHSIDKSDIVESFRLRPDIEELHYAPGVLFWAANTGALTRTAMIGLSKSMLYQNMTVRNLNTIRRLYELLHIDHA